ncbi:hypothetical protein ACFX13_009328 [Malus domestica]
MDPKFLRDLLLCLIVAGRDTTVREATNLKDSSSIDEVAASLTDDAFDKMHYLHTSLSETLRLHPAVPLDAWVCLADDTWPDGFSVKKGSFVGYDAYAMGMMNMGR